MEQEYEFEECPECRNKNLKIYEQIAKGRVVSMRTGRVLEKEKYLETTCWTFQCKCGWESDLKVP